MIKKIFAQMISKMVMNEQQQISFMKLGGNMIALAAVVLSMPSMGFNISVDVLNIAKLIIAIGGAMGISGARDAIGKK